MSHCNIITANCGNDFQVFNFNVLRFGMIWPPQLTTRNTDTLTQQCLIDMFDMFGGNWAPSLGFAAAAPFADPTPHSLEG